MLMHIADILLATPLILMGWEMIANSRLKNISSIDAIPTQH